MHRITSLSHFTFSHFLSCAHPSPICFASLSTSVALCLTHTHSPPSSKAPFLTRNPLSVSVDLSWWQTQSATECVTRLQQCAVSFPFSQPVSFHSFFSKHNFLFYSSLGGGCTTAIHINIYGCEIIYEWFSFLSPYVSIFLSSVSLPQIFLDANTIRLGNIPLGSAVDPLEGAPAGTTYTKQTVYELCACANGKLYLSPAEKGSTCQTTSNFCLWSWKQGGWPSSETYGLTQFEANASQNNESTWIVALGRSKGWLRGHIHVDGWCHGTKLTSEILVTAWQEDKSC